MICVFEKFESYFKRLFKQSFHFVIYLFRSHFSSKTKQKTILEINNLTFLNTTYPKL